MIRRLCKIVAIVTLACAALVAQPNELEPKREYRVGQVLLRAPDGSIARDMSIVAAFRERWACPSTLRYNGACPGWAVDHVIPLSCGGIDAVINMQWLPVEIKSAAGSFAKDRFERRVYRGAGLSVGCK